MWTRLLTIIAMATTCAPIAEAQPFDQLKCLQIAGRSRFKATIDVTTLDPTFGVERGCRILGPRFLCTPSASTVTSSNVPEVVVSAESLETDKVCYAVRCPKSRPPDRHAIDRFGGHALDTKRTGLVCLPAGSVICTPSGPEICDGQDNDCDGAVDELGSISCGVGACVRTVDLCVEGIPKTCTPGAPAGETCNGADDDCDGAIDDGLGTVTCGVGECETTVDACVSGSTSSCTPAEAGTELCDGLDNDCDGTSDEGLDEVIRCGLGACAVEVSTCTDGETEACVPGSPSTEICNTAVDENCNGLVDEQGCVCEAGQADCDLHASNGCETTLATDPAHCGACGAPCGAGETCQAGICGP